VDNQRLAHIAVEVMELGQYCLACKGGMLKNVLLRQDIHEENKTPALHGLEEGLQNWRSMFKVSIRAGSNKVSVVGGQGHLNCNCSGIGDKKRCAYRMAGVLCCIADAI
jgi:hypothetical protein